jgi:DNA-binding NarL/FixJ family response regulator
MQLKGPFCGGDMRHDQPANPAVRVLVADNSVIHTELLAQAIGKDRRIRVVDLGTSASQVLKGMLHAQPDILLISESLDHRPGGGLEILGEVRRTRPELKSIILLDASKRESVVQAFRAGAKGVFCRNEPIKMLCRCISVVNEGQIWANSSELSFLLEALSWVPSVGPADAQSLSALSARERDVIGCLAEGLSNREIATRLSISQHTVKNYMFRIFEKLGVSSRVQLLFCLLSRTGYGQQMLEHLKGSASVKNGKATKQTSVSEPEIKKVISAIRVGDNPKGRPNSDVEDNRLHVAAGGSA